MLIRPNFTIFMHHAMRAAIIYILAHVFKRLSLLSYLDDGYTER